MTESEGEEILCRFERRRAEGHGLKAGGGFGEDGFCGAVDYVRGIYQVDNSTGRVVENYVFLGF